MAHDSVAFTIDGDDGLTQTRWGFYLHYDTLVVNKYSELQRESARHKFKTVRSWERLGNARMNTVSKDAIPLTDEIKAQALETFLAELRAKLTVGFQS